MNRDSNLHRPWPQPHQAQYKEKIAEKMAEIRVFADEKDVDLQNYDVYPESA